MAETPMNGIPPEYQAELQQLMRRRQMAQQMAMMGLQAPATEMVGNRVVRQSPLQHIARLATGFLGHKATEQADTGMAGIQQQIAQARQKQLNALPGNPQAGFTSQDALIRSAAEALSQQRLRDAQIKQMEQKAIPQPVVSSPGQIARDAQGNILWQNPDKPAAPDKPPSSVQEYEYAKNQGYKGSFEQWELSRRRAGASNVSVNTGQKGFENESRLRGDFKSEPIYKAYQETVAAHKQIKAGLKADNPAGDLAAATKFMKLLDPDSVVRESELALAMAASGKLDQLRNIVALKLQGRKLTPTQMQEFSALSDEFLNAAAQGYESKRREYKDLGGKYGLDLGIAAPKLPSVLPPGVREVPSGQ